MKNIIHRHYIELYRTYIYFTFTPSAYMKHTGNEINNGCAACVHQESITLWLPVSDDGTVSLADAAHEVWHMVDFIADKVALAVSHGTGNEHIAYLTGYVMEQLFKAIEIDNQLTGKYDAV